MGLTFHGGASRDTCRVCSAPVVKAALGVCGRVECESRARSLDAIARLKPALDAQEARFAAARKERLEVERIAIEVDLEREAKEIIHGEGLDADEVTVLPVPYFEVHLEPATPTRRLALSEHIRGIVCRARAEPDPESAVVLDSAPDELVTASCSLCRGKCCSAGGNHAFLDETALRSMPPEMSRESMIDLYQRHVPAAGCRDSCIFHGERGCALPRYLRSDTCNRHLCSELRAIKGRTSAHPDHALILGAIADGTLHKTQVLHPTKYPKSDSPPPTQGPSPSRTPQPRSDCVGPDRAPS